MNVDAIFVPFRMATKSTDRNVRNRKRFRLRVAGLVFAAPFMLAGCSGTVFHNTGKAKLSSDGKATHVEIDPTKTVISVQENLNKLKSAEKAARLRKSRNSANRVIFDAVYDTGGSASTRRFIEHKAELYGESVFGFGRLPNLGIETPRKFSALFDRLAAITMNQNDVAKKGAAVAKAAGRTLPCFSLDTPSQPDDPSATDPATKNPYLAGLSSRHSEYLQYVLQNERVAENKEQVTTAEEQLAELEKEITSEDNAILKQELQRQADETKNKIKKLKENPGKWAAQLNQAFKAFFYQCAYLRTLLGDLASGAQYIQQDGSLRPINGPEDCRSEFGKVIARDACRAVGGMARASALFGDVDNLTREFLEAQKEYQRVAARVAAANTEGEADQKALENALGRLSKAVKILDRSEKLIGLDLATEERIKAIDGLVATIKTGKVDEKAFSNPALKRAANIIGTLRSLESITKSFAQSRRSIELQRVSIVREIQAAKLDYLKASIGRYEAETDIRIRKLMLYRQQLELLSDIDLALCRYVNATRPGRSRTCRLGNRKNSMQSDLVLLKPDDNSLRTPPFRWTSDPLANSSISDIWDDGKPEAERQALLEVVRSLAYLKGVGDAENSQANADIRFLEAEATIRRNEVSARMWNAVIGGSLAQLEAYYKGGIKSAELADLIIKLGTLTSIAIKVD